MTRAPERRGWHIDRSVSLPTILSVMTGFLGMVVSGMTAYGHITDRILVLEVQQAQTLERLEDMRRGKDAFYSNSIMLVSI